VIVPKFGHTAVERNVVKRRLRNLARTELLPAETPCDVVLRASPNAYGASYDVLCTAMRTAMKHLPRRTPEGDS
jgi:ribonuclease P protein component